MTQSNQNENSLLLVVCNEKPRQIILDFLKKNNGDEFNPTEIKKQTGLAYNVVTATLDRLSKSGEIWKPQRGFYSYNCTLDKHQIEKIERDVKLQFHNISIKISKEISKESLKTEKGKQRNDPTGGAKQPIKINQKQPKNEVIELSPNRTMTILEYPENFLVVIGCPKNPLDISEFLLLSAHLRTLFGESVDRGLVVKLDVNNDLPMSYTLNEITFGDINGMCFAIYGKGDITRTELRNFNPNVSVSKFLESLRTFVELLEHKPEAEAVKATKTTKPYVYGESKPPLSEFRTGLEILIDRGGEQALEEMRLQYKTATAARLCLNKRAL